MALTEEATGSQTATLDTEHTLSTQATSGVYIGRVNVTNMVDGDTLIIRIKTICRSGDSEAIEQYVVVSDAQTCDNIQTEPIASPHSWKLTIEQTDGTGRAFPWSVISVS